MYRVSARGGLRGADGGDNGALDDDGKQFPPIPLGPPIPLALLLPNVFNGHKNGRCNSQPTSDIMLALRKYGVTSRKNFTEMKKKERN